MKKFDIVSKEIKIGFICTGNSARSQIAEGYAKHFARFTNIKVEVFSAGSNPAGYVHPLAVKVMQEDFIDISKQWSKSLEDIPYNELDIVITLCGDAAESCPHVPSAYTEHWDIPDPAKISGSEDERIAFFRKVRDEIKKKVQELFASLSGS